MDSAQRGFHPCFVLCVCVCLAHPPMLPLLSLGNQSSAFPHPSQVSVFSGLPPCHDRAGSLALTFHVGLASQGWS